MNIKVVFQHAQDWPLSGFFADFTLLLKYLIYTNDNVVEIEFDVRSSLNSGIPFIKENEEIFSKLFIPYKQQNTTYEKIVYVNRYDIVDCSKSIFKAHDLYNKNRNKLYKYNEIFNKYIKLQPHLEEKLKILTTEMKKDCEQTIGIFVRSNALAGEQPTGKMPTRDEYLEAINNLDKSKNIKYFLRIDNNEDLEFYKKNLLNNYHTNIKRSLTNKKDAPHQNSSEYISLEELEEILLEVLLLSKCDKIIHCVSNMAAASLIMNNNQESICLFNKNKKNKVLIWSDPTWALNRIHHDVELYLKDEYDFTYIAYRDQKYINEQINNMFINSKKHLEFDIIITSMWVYYILRDKYPNIPIHNWCFIAYGFAEIKDNNLSNLTNFAVASDCIIDLLPKNIKLHITPISVEPSNFNYKETSRNLEKLGWCGAPSQFWKNSNWTVEIAKKTNLQLSLASRLTLDQLKDWYHSIDLLIVTAGPNKEAETGPLPPFEAIVSGTPVIGTPVGNFRHVPGPKFNTIEEAVTIIEDFKSNPEKKIALAKEQYDFVMKHWTYKTLSESWRTMFNKLIAIETNQSIFNYLMKNKNNLNYNFKNKSDIPKLFHMIWVGDSNIPQKYLENLNKWKDLMPEWNFRLWNNSDINENEFPSDIVQKINNSIKGAQKADIMRYYIIEKYGGVYMDCDVIPHKSLNYLIETYTNNHAILCHDLELTWGYISIGFFAAVPHHPLFQKTCEIIKGVEINTEDIHLHTGPRVLGLATEKTIKDNMFDTYLLATDYFYRNNNFEERYGSHTYDKSW